jgi:deoxycytidylate deaminase
MHAEVAAIQNLRKKNKKFWVSEDLTMIVVRIGGKTGEAAYTKLSKPCHNCQKEIEKMGIKRVFYSVNTE